MAMLVTTQDKISHKSAPTHQFILLDILYVDQNEKLVHFGVTYVMARDGFSGKIVSAAVMPPKNNIVIYENIYRAIWFMGPNSGRSWQRILPNAIRSGKAAFQKR